MLDILTFYQERLANESYLRTATQLDSLTQLSRLIGYQPAPGVAASTYLAFTIKAATGLPPNPTTTAITIPAGTQVQSVPAQGQTPQIVRDLRRHPRQAGLERAARPDRAVPGSRSAGDTSVYLAGNGDTAPARRRHPDRRRTSGPPSRRQPTQLGGPLVTLRDDRHRNSGRCVTWAEGLTPGGTPGDRARQVFALRQRAACSATTPSNPLMLATRRPRQELLRTSSFMAPTGRRVGTLDVEFQHRQTTDAVDLDAVYAKLVARRLARR